MPLLFHPLVVHFPVALWLTSFLFDVLGLRRKQPFFAAVSRYLIGLGLLGAAVSMAAGFVDYGALVAGGIGQAFVDQHRVHSTLAYGTTVETGEPVRFQGMFHPAGSNLTIAEATRSR